tara:strand:- start:287 stop:682 length:396 start_codon:yes stop_codon:yes gene_type:complete
MANYVAYARSNYFKVKDEKAFMAWADGLDIEYHEGHDNTFMVMAVDGESWPTNRWNDDIDDQEDINFSSELSTHLADGWVAILIEIGHEKMRFLHGYSEAFNNKGELISKLLCFNNDELKILGKYFTNPEY